MSGPGYPFKKRLERILNAGQSRSVALTGNIFDWFLLTDDKGEETYVPVLDLLTRRWGQPELAGFCLVVYELNGPIRILRPEDAEALRKGWTGLLGGISDNEAAIRSLAGEQTHHGFLATQFERALTEAKVNPTTALEFLRQLCLVSRSERNGRPLLDKRLIIIIEGADMLIPQGEIGRLSEADRRRVMICRDWFCDPGFMNGGDSVILLTESVSRLNAEIARLPQLLEVEIPAPDLEQRKYFISWFKRKPAAGAPLRLWGSQTELAQLTAGLSLQALMQLLKGAAYSQQTLGGEDVVAKVEAFIRSQLGEDVVEFHKPRHTLQDVVGNRRLRAFLREHFIPRLKSSGRGAIGGAVVAGALGSGKTYLFEALAGELGIVVLVLKNLRSKWFGETDVVFERLRRVLEALGKVLIFVDEADTQFGGVGADTHETERRLTGKIQAMMSDTRLRGRVVWLLMTARVNLLSPDLRRPGRAGDLIIPVLDPEGEDQADFVRWVLKAVRARPSARLVEKVCDLTLGYSAAAYDAIRRELEAAGETKSLSEASILETIENRLPADIETTRQRQTLEALINCTHRQLLPEGIEDVARQREMWREELRRFNAGM